MRWEKPLTTTEATQAGRPGRRRSALRSKLVRYLLLVLAVFVVGVPALGWLAYSGPPIIEHLSALPTDERVVALSFDDGPNPPHTDVLLALLEREDIRATFFMTGQHVAAHPEAARRVVEAGHYVGNHAWDEKPVAAMTPTRARAVLARTDAALREIGVTGPIDVRAPGLAIGFGGAFAYRAGGRRHIGATAGGTDWTRSPVEDDPPCDSWLWDWICPSQDPDRIVERVMSDIEPGAIILLHDGHDALAGVDRSGTVEATRRLIERLRGDGYRFVAVQDFTGPALRKAHL